MAQICQHTSFTYLITFNDFNASNIGTYNGSDRRLILWRHFQLAVGLHKSSQAFGRQAVHF